MKEKGERLYDPINIDDLIALRQHGTDEHEASFKRNAHLRSAYYDNLIGIFLCQGAASHYLDPSVGINDFDIWHFYRENENVRFPYRGHRRIEDGYKGRPIDFLKRAIPAEICFDFQGDVRGTVMEYLFKKDTKTKVMLLAKAIIGLYPEELFSQVLWPGSRGQK